MATSTVTTIDNGSIELEGGKFRDETLLFAAADVYAAGLILARQVVSDTIAVAYTRADDSDYTGVASAIAGNTLQLGNYVITAGTLTTGVGVWTCVAPNSVVETFTSTAADDDLVFEGLGLSVAVTAVTEVFDSTDVITVTAAAQSGLPLVPFVVAGANGTQVPVAILTYAVTATAAGSIAARVLVAGEVNATRLVIDADGDATNVTKNVMDKLASQGIVATAVTQLAQLDNGAS